MGDGNRMHSMDKLVALIGKIFPEESCTSESVANYVRRLALRKVEQGGEHFVPVETQQGGEAGQYLSQPIPPSPVRKSSPGEPYATFRRMRQMGGQGGSYWNSYGSTAEAFCVQAEFMKDFTDEWEQSAPFEAYYPTYEKMDDAQLRTYFTWRTKVRRGVIDKTSLSYVFCYIYELINDIGVADPAEGLEALLALWTAYRQYSIEPDPYLTEWLRDYYVVHHAELKVPFSDYRRRFPIPCEEEETALLTKVKACRWDDLDAIEVSSSFKITNGQFYKNGDRQMIGECACFVLRALAEHFKHSGVDLRNLFFENRREKCGSLFQYAVHANVDLPPVTVPLNEFEAMKHNKRGWQREYITITQYRSAVGYLLKCIEVHMRQHFGYKRSLQMPNDSVVMNCFLNSEPEKFSWYSYATLSKLKVWKGRAYAVIAADGFTDIIAKAVADYCASKHIVVQNGIMKVVKPVEIDFRKLKAIERDYIETAEKLILAEEEPPTVAPAVAFPAVAAAPGVSGMAGLAASLPEGGRALLAALLAGERVPPNHELLVEAINERALEAIFDNLIDYADGVPYVYEEYRDELKSSLGGQV